MADIVEMKNLDASEIHDGRFNGKEVFKPKVKNHVLDRRWNNQFVQKRPRFPKFRMKKSDYPARGEERESDLQRESDGSQPSDTLRVKPDMIFWRIIGNCIHRHHVEPRDKLCVPIDESCSIALECIGVVWRTHTTLDVLLESRIDDDWDVECWLATVGSMDRFHAVHNIF